MAKILVLYASKTGNTGKMAQAVTEGVTESGCQADLLNIKEAEPTRLLDYQGLIVGSPVYYGMPTAPIKQFFDESVVLHGKLSGRVGAAFSSSANVGGGNETTCLAILQMMLVHGMVVVGSAEGDHYGPVSVGTPDTRVIRQCRTLGGKVAELVLKLA